MGNRQNLPHSQLTENKPKSQNQPPSEKVISHFYRKKFARPGGVRADERRRVGLLAGMNWALLRHISSLRMTGDNLSYA
jgi:hypothetical protein